MIVILFLVWAGVQLNTAHLFSPIIQVWTHPELRCVALREWDWYIVVPLGLFTLALLIPLEYVSIAYAVWNAWHFGTQNYGLAALRWRLRRKLGWKLGLLGGTASGMQLEIGVLGQPLNILGPFTVFHGASDLWLSWHVTPHRWLFVGLAMALSFTGLVFASPSVRHALPVIIGARMGLGFVHFLYSRWVPWKGLWQRHDLITAS